LHSDTSSAKSIFSIESLLISPLRTWIFIGNNLPSAVISMPSLVRFRTSGSSFEVLSIHCWDSSRLPLIFCILSPLLPFYIKLQVLVFIAMEEYFVLLGVFTQIVVIYLVLVKVITCILELVLEVEDFFM
jgi:hypothetical protein